MNVCVFVAMSLDVLSVVVFTADLSLCVHINLVMSLDHDSFIYIYKHINICCNVLGCSKCEGLHS